MIIALIVLSLVSLAIAIVALVQLRALSMRFTATLGDGKSADSLDNVLNGHMQRVDEVAHRLSELEYE